MALLRLALTAWHSFDMSTAQALVREALALVEEASDVALQADAEWTLGQVETIAGEVERARSDIERLAERLRPERQDRRNELTLLRMWAVLARFEGRRVEAIAHLEAGLRLAEEIGLPGEQWQMLAELVGLRGASGDDTGAAVARANAEAIVAALAARIADHELRSTYLRAISPAQRVPIT